MINPNMICREITEWNIAWQKGSRSLVRIKFKNFPPESYFVSAKQLRSFPSYGWGFAVTEDGRFVWASESLEWICKSFKAELQTNDPHYTELQKPTMVEHDDLKN